MSRSLPAGPRLPLVDERRISRRRFLGRLGAAGIAAGAGSLLASCGTEGTGGATIDVDATHPEVPLDELDFANWPLYVDRRTIPEFERRYGVRVNYFEEINDDNEFFAKIRGPLSRGQDIGRDLIVPNDVSSARLIDLGYVEALDEGNLPNAANLRPELRHPAWDPRRDFSLPWQSGMTAIGYNRRETGRELASVNDLFDPAFRGRVTMLADELDSPCLVLLGMGIDPATATLDDLLAAVERIEAESRKGQIRRFTGNDYTTDLANGNVAVAVAYSGDVIQLQFDDPDLELLIPEEGAVLWSDNMMIPAGAQHPYAAEVMMNYVYEPEVAARIAAYVNYMTPVLGAREVLAETDPRLADSELIFPSDETLSRLHPYPTLSPDDALELRDAMAQVVGA